MPATGLGPTQPALATDFGGHYFSGITPMRRGGGGQRSAVVVDDFDVVPVGVQDERAVVAGVVYGALPRTAVVLIAGGEGGGVERAHRSVVAGGERQVDVLREWPFVIDQREAVVLARELHAARLVVPQPDPGLGRDGRVEALGRR